MLFNYKNINNYDNGVNSPTIELKDGVKVTIQEFANRFYDKDGKFIDSKCNIEAIAGKGASRMDAINDLYKFDIPFSEKITDELWNNYLVEKKELVFDYLTESLSTFFATTSLTFSQVFFLCLFLIFIGFFGIIFSRLNILIVLMSIELILLGVSLLFILFSVFLQDAGGQVFALIILTVAAAEAAAGLAILVVHNRLTRTILLDNLNFLRG